MEMMHCMGDSHNYRYTVYTHEYLSHIAYNSD